MLKASHLVALACACGGAAPTAPHGPQPAPVAAEFTAARWIPARPTYAIVARSLRDAQRATTDLFATLGVLIDVDAGQLGRELARILVVDPLVPDQLTAIGIDVEGGFAVFSEGISPTLVVRVSGPDQLAAFFQQQRERGMKTSSLMAANVEVFSTKISAALTLSWALDGDWLWVHFGTPLDRATEDWFVSSRKESPPTWTAGWKRPAALGPPKLAGFVDVRAVLGKLPKVADAVACTRLIEPIGSIGFSVTTDGSFAGVSIAADLGAASETVRKALLPPPQGWDDTARRAPLAAQWNLDLAVVRKWVAPCVTVAGFDPFHSITGIRAARAILMSLEPDDNSGTGAVAVDLASSELVRSLLDRIPMRSTFESDKSFGPYRGKSIAIPLGPTVEYVVTDSLALAGVGDGVLARAIGRGPGTPTTTILGLDILPAGLSAEAWTWLFDRAHIPARKRGVERLQRWRDLHVSLRLEGGQLVLQASGNRG